MNKNQDDYVEIKRGDIVYIDIPKDEFDSHKQCGLRPCIIMSNDMNNKHNSRILYIPLTSKEKKYLPTHIQIKHTTCLSKKSVALCECLDAINKNFIKSKIGEISSKDMYYIEIGKDIQLSDNGTFKFLVKSIRQQLCYA